MSDLYLRKVTHPQAHDNYRVILKRDGDEIEIGSIGLVNIAGPEQAWRWGIDTVIPMRELESEGRGQNRKDCMRLFKTAWERFIADPARQTEFFEAKRRSRRAGLK